MTRIESPCRQHESGARPGVRRERVLAVTAAVLAPALLWVVAVPLLGSDLRVAQGGARPPMEVTLPLVALTAAVASLAGWALLALLEHRVGRARTVWTSTAIAVLIVSLAPLLVPGDTAASTRLVLALMHIAVAAVLIPGLGRSTARGHR